MTLKFPAETMDGVIRPQDVVDFLLANPAFLDEHPDLLRALSIPHQSGDAVSLLERQIAAFREENSRLKKQIKDWGKLARQNEALNQKIHALVLALMHAVGPQAIFANLDQTLREQFGADRVQCLIFADATFVDSGDSAHFIGARSDLRAPFAALIASGKSVCGTLEGAAQQALFASSDAGGSAVLMPLRGNFWDGVLAIASDDGNRYQGDMGTEFLSFLKEIVTLVLDPWVKRARVE
jgi:uncharacterized protein